MRRAFVFVAVVGSHDELARSDSRHLQLRFVSHLLVGRMYRTLMSRKIVDIETSELRKRVRAAIDQSRRAAAARRVHGSTPRRPLTTSYSKIPPFRSHTCSRMRCVPKATTSACSRRTAAFAWRRPSPPTTSSNLRSTPRSRSRSCILRVNQARGRRVVQHERAIKGRTPIDRLTEEDVLQALLEELGPFVER